MDIISHGLWGGIIFGRENKKDFFWAFVIGVAPDLFSFGIFTAMRTLGLASGPDWGNGVPNASLIPVYVHSLYNFTHSLIVFALVFALVTIIRRKPFIPMLAWFLHILMDIPTHSTRFFPTPFLWPISTYKINGIPWSHPVIFFSDIVILFILYIWFFVINKKIKK
jgi:membrane-bound metal-dependent hydrolase YbcI (DUF457 family)